MKYSELVNFFEIIESTQSRNMMTNHLVSLFRNTPTEDIDRVVYLTEGKLYPAYVGIELGIAEKSALKALSMSLGMSLVGVENEYKKKGDIGIIAENLSKTKVQMVLFKRELSVQDVYNDLDKIARMSGSGSNDAKLRILSGLLSDASPKEAKYIMRIVTGKMRLGVASNTIVVALAQAFAHGKKDDIENMYNVTSDLGEVAKALKMNGLEGIKKSIRVGRPIRMMLAQRMSSAKEIVTQMGKVICEYKYDGMRLQIHKSGDKISLFTRNLEHITDQYPDVVKYARENIRTHEAIIEGECVGVDPAGYMLPFQELMHRRRKYEISEKVKEFPVHVYVFDMLHVNGMDIMTKGLLERRNILKNAIIETDNFKLSHAMISGNNISGNNISGNNISGNNISGNNVSGNNVSGNNISGNNISGNNISGNNISGNNVSGNNVSGNNVSGNNVSGNDAIGEIEKFFESSIESGCEGLMMKDINSFYQAGARGWSWVKLKRSYQSKMAEPIDVVIVGAFIGKGRRSGAYGALLGAVYDSKKDVFSTICKIGSGFTDEELNDLTTMLGGNRLDKKHVRVDSIMNADIWFEPKLVMEIIGDELTLSPIHTCGLDIIRKNAGLAIRFPRFLHKFRWDKTAEDATTTLEIIDMYKSQLKKIGD